MNRGVKAQELKEPKVLYVFEHKSQRAKRALRWLWLGPVFDRLVSLMK